MKASSSTQHPPTPLFETSQGAGSSGGVQTQRSPKTALASSTNAKVIHAGAQQIANSVHSSQNSGATLPITATITRSSALDVESILRAKLEDKNYQLTSEQSLALLMECINRGEREAVQATGKELVMVIGNTGAGKSTLVNYLSGCTMQRVNPRDLRIASLANTVVVVKPKSKGGNRNEVMAIGHTEKSMTFIPEIVSVEQGLTYCDCPGFIDNRGIAINIANAVNIKKMFTQAASIKIVLLINYHTLKSNLEGCLSNMIKICCELFGSTNEGLAEFKESILLGITNVPFASPLEEGEEEAVLTIEDLKKWITSANLPNKFALQALNQLSERVFIYDPEDVPNLEYSGPWNRDELKRQIRDLKPIVNPSDIFKTVLSNEDEIGLIDVCTMIKGTIDAIFQKKTLSEEDFIHIADHLEKLTKLMIIEHPRVVQLVYETRGLVTRHFVNMIHEIDLEFSQAIANLSAESEQVLAKFRTGIQRFDEQVQREVNIDALQARYEEYKLKQEAREAIRGLAQLETNIYQHCGKGDFESAEESYSAIQIQVAMFMSKYSATGIAHGQNLVTLERLCQITRDKMLAVRMADQERDNQMTDFKRNQGDALAHQQRQAETRIRTAEERLRAAEDRERATEERLRLTDRVLRCTQEGAQLQSMDGRNRIHVPMDILQEQEAFWCGVVPRPLKTAEAAIVHTEIGDYYVADLPVGTTLGDTPWVDVYMPGAGKKRIFYPN